MGARQEKYWRIGLFCFFLMRTSAMSRCSEINIDIKPLESERFYAETPALSVVRTIKQLCATMRSIKNSSLECGDCTITTILEIQSLSVCGAFQELDRAVGKGLVVGDDQAQLIKRLWEFLQELSQDDHVKTYLQNCQS